MYIKNKDNQIMNLGTFYIYIYFQHTQAKVWLTKNQDRIILGQEREMTPGRCYMGAF